MSWTHLWLPGGPTVLGCTSAATSQGKAAPAHRCHVGWMLHHGLGLDRHLLQRGPSLATKVLGSMLGDGCLGRQVPGIARNAELSFSQAAGHGREGQEAPKQHGKLLDCHGACARLICTFKKRHHPHINFQLPMQLSWTGLVRNCLRNVASTA